jgi:hypothetical protein
MASVQYLGPGRGPYLGGALPPGLDGLDPLPVLVVTCYSLTGQSQQQ